MKLKLSDRKVDLKAFKVGGVHPHDCKYTAEKPVEKAHMPNIVRIPMSMHIGAPAKLLVKEGDQIEEGRLLGEASGFISANIHSSVSGKVIGVVSDNTLTAKKIDFVEIETGGSIRNWYDNPVDETKLKPEAMLDKIREAGIVGMGGATFPTHVKMATGKSKPEFLIINAAECEPFLTVDYRMMMEEAPALLRGIEIAKRVTGAEKVIIGIEANKPLAIEKMTEVFRDHKNVTVEALRTRYPQGGEKQLIQALTGKEVPSGNLPLNIGVVVLNVGTIYAIFEAVVHGKPLIERSLTFSGEKMPNSGNYKVRIGTPVQTLIDEFGVPENHGSIISGGPMMGLEVTDLNLPVMKGTSGITVLSKKLDYAVKNDPCVRCSACIFSCPIGLHPYMLGKLVEKNRIEEAAKKWGLMDCIECGSCAYACQSTIPLVGLIRFGKMLWRKKQAKK